MFCSVCVMFISIRLCLNMGADSVELCVSVRLCPSMRTQGHLPGNNRERSRHVIRRWVFPNAVLSACWRGGMQMTRVQLWQTRSLGGNHHRWVRACVWERAGDRPWPPLRQSAVMIVFLCNKFMPNFFLQPVHLVLPSRLYSSARKYTLLFSAHNVNKWRRLLSSSR